MTTPGLVSDNSGFGLVSIRGVSTLLNNVEIDGAHEASNNSGFLFTPREIQCGARLEF